MENANGVKSKKEERLAPPMEWMEFNYKKFFLNCISDVLRGATPELGLVQIGLVAPTPL